MKFWTKKAFKELQEVWYQHLAESGFKDIEVMVSGADPMIKQLHAHGWYYRRRDHQLNDYRDYYQVINNMVQGTVFTNDIDRLIMTRHAEGAKQIAIVRELASIGIKRHKHTIKFKIRKYEMAWGIRTYTPRQLNRKVS